MPSAASSRLDVIVAQATARGAGARGILRLSGPALLTRADVLLPPRCPRPSAPARREVLIGDLAWAPGVASPVEVWVLPGPGTATGEDVLELHLPGAQPVLDLVLEEMLRRGARRAEPGEFTRRAWLNGRLDLTQAAAVLDLVQASSAAAARAAAAVLAGGLRAPTEAAREALTAALIEIEAGLDFAEGDAQDVTPGEVAALLARADAALDAGERTESQRAMRADAAFRVLLVGEPNAGKSSLFRALTGVDALVADEAGTTRDRLEGAWQAPAAAGAAWLLLDGPGRGAGEASDPRDAAARARGAADFGEADFVWACVDASRPGASLPAVPPELPGVLVLTKSDLPTHPDARRLAAASPWPVVAVSAASASGFVALAAATAAAAERAEIAQRERIASAARHAACFHEARTALARARAWLAAPGGQDRAAEELRAALHALVDVSGAVLPEELLDRLFARFCIGK